MMTSKQMKQASDEVTDAYSAASQPVGDAGSPTVSSEAEAAPEKPVRAANRVRTLSKAAAQGEADAVAPSTTVAPMHPPAGADPRGRKSEQAASAVTAQALRAHKLQMLMVQLAGKAWNNQVGTMTLPWHMNTQDWQELVAIQQAVLSRCEQQYKQWVEGCAEIAQDYAQLRASNTLSKLVDHESNLVTQCQSLWSSQFSNWVGLVENVQVDYAYWLSQKQAPVLNTSLVGDEAGKAA